MSLQIDIEQILRDRNPKLARILPRPLLRWATRLLRQREINAVLQKYGHLRGTAFIEAVLKEWGYRPRVKIEGEIDPARRYIFASNHPLGGIDGLILAAEIEKRYGPVQVMVNDLLMHLEPVRPLFVPINKHGRQTADYVRKLDAMYASDAQVLLFPAGLCSRRNGRTIEDLPWKKNVITKAVEYGRDVVPVWFDAVNSRSFYRWATLRKWLGIKVNIEMALLPGEMFRQPDKQMKIVFGDPIPHSTFTRDKRPEAWAAWLRERVYALKTTR
jgi:putative hemolysin